jgi:hypothetical protein
MDNITVKQSTIHGNGIFATSPIGSGVVIENSIIIPLSFRSRYHFDPQLYRYLHINWNCDCQECQSHGFVMYLMTGHSMLYNYSDEPNAELVFDYKNNLLEVKAIKDISTNDEIIIKDLKKEYREKFESQDK